MNIHLRSLPYLFLRLLPNSWLHLVHVLFYKKKVYKKMKLKWSKSEENLKKITRLKFQNLVFLLAKNRYCIQNVKNGI